MKISELVGGEFGIWTSHEEHAILEQMSEPRMMSSYTEREQTIINQLIRKDLVVRVKGVHNDFVYPNR
jgi:hypothetical protein